MKKVWYQTKLGMQLIETQRKKLAHILPTLQGYHLLQVAPRELTSCVDSSLILHRVNTHTDLIAQDDALPIVSDSIDVVVLNYSLEQRQYDPHQILKEAYRVLIPGGYLVITGFNLWTICKLKLMVLDDNIKWLRKQTVKNWLSLLDCQLVDSLCDANAFFEPSYTLVAVKRIIPLTLIKPAWSKPELDWATNEEVS